MGLDEVSTPLKPAPTALPGVPAGASLRSPATSSAAGAGAAAGTSKVAVKVARRPITKRPVTFHSDEVCVSSYFALASVICNDL